MNASKKMVLLFGLALAGLGFVPTASAVTVQATGLVYSIASFSSTTGWYDVISLQVSSLGTCPKDANGNIAIRFTKNTDGTDPSANRLFTLALTAYTLGKPLTVQVNDTVLLNGDCEAMYFKLSQ